MADASMNLKDQETEVERKEHINEESDVVNEAKTQAGFESTNQEQKKQVKRPRKKDGRRTKYDAQGIHKRTQRDLCDCLIVDCPGCFMPCKKCSSTKCGHECRRNRSWEYENIEIQGTSINIKNAFKK